MQSLITILREVHDPRDFNSCHEVGTILFLALAATLCALVMVVLCAALGEVERHEISDGGGRLAAGALAEQGVGTLQAEQLPEERRDEQRRPVRVRNPVSRSRRGGNPARTRPPKRSGRGVPRRRWGHGG